MNWCEISPSLSPFKGITTTFVRSGCKARPLAIEGSVVPVDEQCNGDLFWYDAPKGRREYVVCNGRYLRIVPVPISKRKGKEAK